MHPRKPLNWKAPLQKSHAVRSTERHEISVRKWYRPSPLVDFDGFYEFDEKKENADSLTLSD